MSKVVSKQEIENIRPLTGLQQSMLYRARSEPHAGHYIEQLIFEFERFDSDAMAAALQTLVDRRRALRSFFVWREQEEAKLLTLNRAAIEPEFISLKPMEELICGEREKGLELNKAPMMRFSIADAGNGHVFCVWNLHHAIVDGWSIVLLQDELLDFYRAYRDKTQVKAEETEAEWPAPVSILSDHWRNLLAESSAGNILQLIPPVTDKDNQDTEIYQTLSAQDSSKIHLWCQEQKITFATYMQFVWGLLLAHLSGKNEGLFGTVDSGRGTQSIEDTAVGMFMVLKPVRVRFSDEQTIYDCMRSFQWEQWNLGKDVPPGPAELAQILGRSQGQDLFDTILNIQNYPETRNWQDIGLKNVKGFELADAPLTLSIGTGELIRFLFRFQADILDLNGVKALAKLFLQLVQQISNHGGSTRISTVLDYFSQSTGIISANPDRNEDFTSCIVRFTEKVLETPEAIALIGQQKITYHGLSQAAESIRGQLAERGVRAGDIIGIHLPRSVESVAAMLAVLALDACYLPLDPDYPRTQLDYMLEDSGAKLVISESDNHFPIPSLPIPSAAGDDVIELNQPLVCEHMCLIYTSGSTGRPKGVFLRHDAVTSRLQWMSAAYPYSREDVCCHRTPISFVDSVCEVFSALCAGLPAVVIDNNTLRDLNGFIGVLQEYSITRLTLVPSLLDAILDQLADPGTGLPKLRLCVVSGEALSGELAEKFSDLLPACRLLNLYGSTEVTADALAYEVPRALQSQPLVPIGKPLAGFSARVINQQGRALPGGFVGELLIGGVGVTSGYLNQPRLTDEKFSGIGFRTGDLAYMDKQEHVHYLGRVDRQIKIRGQRVEPAAVEARLKKFPGIEQVVVFTKNNTLIAAYTGSTSDTQALHKHMGEELPAFSNPQRYLPLDAMPMLANGKIDYRQLATLAGQAPGEEVSVRERSLYQRQLAYTIANIWQELLPDTSINENSHFFDSGGHSLLAMRMIAQTEKALGFGIALPLLINHPILQDFAAALTDSGQAYTKAGMICLRKGRPDAAIPLFCIHGDAFNIVSHIKDRRPVYWLSQWAERMELTKRPSFSEPESIDLMAGRYARYIESVQTKRGCDLIAACGAAVVAIEIARRLGEKGFAVNRLILMDLPRGELQAPWLQKLRKRQHRSWWKSLYHYSFSQLGGRALYLRSAHRKIEQKVKNHIPLNDSEAKTYTDVRLYDALSAYEPKPYTGRTELVFSGRWHRGVDSPDEAKVPPFWSGLLTQVEGFHFSPVQDHNDLLQGAGAAFAARIICMDTSAGKQ